MLICYFIRICLKYYILPLCKFTLSKFSILIVKDNVVCFKCYLDFNCLTITQDPLNLKAVVSSKREGRGNVPSLFFFFFFHFKHASTFFFFSCKILEDADFFLDYFNF